MGRILIFLSLFCAGLWGYGNKVGQCTPEHRLSDPSSISGKDDTLHGDTLQKFARFLYADHETSNWMVRLGFLRSYGEKLSLYNNAYDHGIFIGNKAGLDLDPDSAWFHTGLPVDEAERLFRELYLQARNNPLSSPSATVIDCSTAAVACSETTYSFPSGTGTSAPPAVSGYPNYGCLLTQPGPAWYYMQIGTAGNIIISISQVNTAGCKR